jgi:hypothetical protein
MLFHGGDHACGTLHKVAARLDVFVIKAKLTNPQRLIVKRTNVVNFWIVPLFVVLSEVFDHGATVHKGKIGCNYSIIDRSAFLWSQV